MILALNYTQHALNRTIDFLYRIEAQTNAIVYYTNNINERLFTFMNEVETHFLHTPLSDILSNKLNLHFIHHHDLMTVIEFIFSCVNVDFRNDTSSYPIIDLISRLLIQQNIHFILRPANLSNSVIGLLSISSFFAASSTTQLMFNI